MVKLGNNFSEKNNGKVVSEDGFDTIPLITPLDASQLQFPPPDKVRLCIWYSPLIWRITIWGLYRPDPYSIFPSQQIGQLGCWKWRKTIIISRKIQPWTFYEPISSCSYNCKLIGSFFHVCACVLCLCQVVVKTKADYDGESKKGKLRSPKIAEFSISIIEGVSERLKVRILSLPLSVCFIHHPIFYNISHAFKNTCISWRPVSL